MGDQYIQGRVMRAVSELRQGDRVDLQADPIADPDIDPMGEGNPAYLFEFQVVAEIEHETADCIVVHFENGPSVGFPPDHLVDVDGEQVRGAA